MVRNSNGNEQTLHCHSIECYLSAILYELKFIAILTIHQAKIDDAPMSEKMMQYDHSPSAIFIVYLAAIKR